MQSAHDLTRHAANRDAHHPPTRFPLPVRGAFPRLPGLPPAKAKRLLVGLLISVLLAATPASAHQWNFFPIGWAGPFYDGSTAQYHPERLCGLYCPSYACVVASTSYLGLGLVRYPVWVTNNQGLAVHYCTNDRDTKGWIVVIGVTGLSWSFAPLFSSWYFDNCNTPNRCNMFTPGTTGSTAWLPRNSSGGTYYQATHHGNYCW